MGSTSTEIERKFLVRRVPEQAHDHPGTDIRQGYLAVTETDEVRIRRRGDRHTLTMKSGRGMTRVEEEVNLSLEIFEALWPLTDGRRVFKVRHEVQYHGLTIELDEYKGNLDGLHVAEVEFSSITDADGFSPPSWFDCEVTEDPAYANRALASR
jgi:adenylate cyclase